MNKEQLKQINQINEWNAGNPRVPQYQKASYKVIKSPIPITLKNKKDYEPSTWELSHREELFIKRTMGIILIICMLCLIVEIAKFLVTDCKIHF